MDEQLDPGVALEILGLGLEGGWEEAVSTIINGASHETVRDILATIVFGFVDGGEPGLAMGVMGSIAARELEIRGLD